MNKEIRKYIKMTRLRNKYLTNQCVAFRKAYISQGNLCVCIVRKAKWDYYNKRDCLLLTQEVTKKSFYLLN